MTATQTDAARLRSLADIYAVFSLGGGEKLTSADLRSIADRLDALDREPVPAGANAEGLKDCPFCGGYARMVNEYWVTCTSCHVETEAFERPEKAAEVWNRRAPVPAPAGVECWAVFSGDVRMKFDKSGQAQVFAGKSDANRAAEEVDSVAPCHLVRLDREPAAAQRCPKCDSPLPTYCEDHKCPVRAIPDAHRELSAAPAVEKQPEPHTQLTCPQCGRDTHSTDLNEVRECPEHGAYCTVVSPAEAAAAQTEADEGETCATCRFYDAPGCVCGVCDNPDSPVTNCIAKFGCILHEPRPQPEKPETKETPELPEFVRTALQEWFDQPEDYNCLGVIPFIAKCFRFPHDPPHEGDCRLVVQTCGKPDAKKQEFIRLAEAWGKSEASRAELLRLLKEVLAIQSRGHTSVSEEAWQVKARAAIAEEGA